MIDDGSAAYIYGPGDLPVEQITAGATQWFFADAQGSTTALTDSNGAVCGTFTYDAWGKTTAHTGTITALRYAGQIADDVTGFIYLRARYYDPATALFVSIDPLVALTRAAYGYVANNPLNAIDLLGLWGAPWDWTKDEWGQVALVAGAVALAATIATLTVATGGLALVVVGAVAAGADVIATAASAIEAARECADGGPVGACVADVALTAVPFGVGRLAGRMLQDTATAARHVADSSRLAARKDLIGIGVGTWAVETFASEPSPNSCS